MPPFLEARNAFTGLLARDPARVKAVKIFVGGVARGKLEQQAFGIADGNGARREEKRL